MGYKKSFLYIRLNIMYMNIIGSRHFGVALKKLFATRQQVIYCRRSHL